MIRLLLSPLYWKSIVILTRAALIRMNKNSILGSLWSLIQPLAHMFVISYIFSVLLQQSNEVMIKNLAAGLPLWTFMSNSFNSAGNSLLSRDFTIKRFKTSKTMFIFTDVGVHIITLLYSIIAMYLLIGGLYFSSLSIYMIFAPIVIIPLIVFTMAISLAIGFLTPYIRDIPQMVQLGMTTLYWTVPIIYPYSIVPESKQIFFQINPFFHLIHPLQVIFVEQRFPDFILLAKASLVSSIAVIISYAIYRKVARNVIYYL